MCLSPTVQPLWLVYIEMWTRHELYFLQLPSSQVKCPGQTTLQGTTTPMARCTHLRAGITHRPLHMASLPTVVYSQASPLLPTLLVQTPLCTRASRGAILRASRGDILPARTQDSLTPLGIQELATPVPLPCPLSCHLPYHQISWALVRQGLLSISMCVF